MSPESATFLVLAVLAGLFLAGCEATTERTPVDQATLDELPPPPAAVPFDSTTPNGPAMPYNGMVALQPVTPPRVNENPQQLMGLDRATLGEKLGKPTLIRRDGDAEIWQYRADRCVLDLFLYGMNKKVEHIDLRNRGDEGDESEDSISDCFNGMLRTASPST
ncbi:MAG: hypothetical protein IMF08_03655 [Proteobacteria bacterium]|nr:hypothetical protein [Pseudomonadota bacterium]